MHITCLSVGYFVRCLSISYHSVEFCWSLPSNAVLIYRTCLSVWLTLSFATQWPTWHLYWPQLGYGTQYNTSTINQSIYLANCAERRELITTIQYDLQWRDTSIDVDLVGVLGGRMASAKGGSVPSGVGYEERCPLSSRLMGLGERRELPQRGEPRPKTDFGIFWRPQNAHFCIYMTKSGGTICISVPRL